MDIIEGAGLEQQSDQSEIGHLLDWVYYHNALSRFAMHHWCHKSVDLEATDAIRLDTTNAQYLPLVKDRRVRPMAALTTFPIITRLHLLVGHSFVKPCSRNIKPAFGDMRHRARPTETRKPR